jgi:hypothetical protein
MAGVLAQDRPQVPFVVDEDPVGALGSCGAYPSPGVTVRAGSAAGFYYLQATAGEDPGQTQTVTFHAGARQPGLLQQSGQFAVEPGSIDVYVGDSSQAGLHDQFTVR